MFFVNNDILRHASYDQNFIDEFPGCADRGEFTMYDWCDLAADTVKKSGTKIGWVHPLNVGPDFQMAMASFGIEIYNAQKAKLQTTKSGLSKYYGWLKYCVDNCSLPADITKFS